MAGGGGASQRDHTDLRDRGARGQAGRQARPREREGEGRVGVTVRDGKYAPRCVTFLFFSFLQLLAGRVAFRARRWGMEVVVDVCVWRESSK